MNSCFFVFVNNVPFFINFKKYREISEVSRQIELLSSKCRSIPDLFSSELIDKRAKLRDTCVNILLEFPKPHGRIVREKLWRHVYYDVICRARRLQRVRKTNLTTYMIYDTSALTGTRRI